MHFSERTRRIIAILEKKYGKLDERSKLKDIGKRDFSKIDLSIFNKANNIPDFYSQVFAVIRDEYQDLNEYFIPNLKTQKPFLYTLVTNQNLKKYLLEILKNHGDELSPTFNEPEQCSLLHCLAKQTEEFTKEDKKIFKLVSEKTFVVTRNRFKRSYLETAVAQKSKNLKFMLENSKMANRRILWAISK